METAHDLFNNFITSHLINKALEEYKKNQEACMVLQKDFISHCFRIGTEVEVRGKNKHKYTGKVIDYDFDYSSGKYHIVVEPIDTKESWETWDTNIIFDSNNICRKKAK